MSLSVCEIGCLPGIWGGKQLGGGYEKGYNFTSLYLRGCICLPELIAVFYFFFWRGGAFWCLIASSRAYTISPFISAFPINFLNLYKGECKDLL